jgi:hypothetical protein
MKYSSVAGTATAPADYTAKLNKTLTFNVGQVYKAVTVSVKGDFLNEPDEFLTVVLSNLTGPATLVDDTGVITIVDDE